MTSNAGALPWKNVHDAGNDDGGGVTEGLPELSEEGPSSAPSVRRVMRDGSDANVSPHQLRVDFGRSRSLSAVGVVAVHDLRVSERRMTNWIDLFTFHTCYTAVNSL